MVTREEVLAERFGTFELRSGSAWPEAGKILFNEPVDDAGNERRFGTNDREVYLFTFCEFDQVIDVVGRHRHIADLVLACRAGITGRDQHLVGGLGTLPCEGMFAAAGSNYQYFHSVSCRSAPWCAKCIGLRFENRSYNRFLNAGNAACR
jgi:hypothetical protein